MHGYSQCVLIVFIAKGATHYHIPSLQTLGLSKLLQLVTHMSVVVRMSTGGMVMMKLKTHPHLQIIIAIVVVANTTGNNCPTPALVEGTSKYVTCQVKNFLYLYIFLLVKFVYTLEGHLKTMHC